MTHHSINRYCLKVKHKTHQMHRVMAGIISYHLSRQPLAPREMIINLTYWCNSRCIMCNIWQMKPKNELSFAEWEKIMKDKIFHTISTLTISGGEASMHPQMTKLIELFIQSMPKLTSLNIITNGFTPETTVQKITDVAKLCTKKHIRLSISVSLDGIGSQHETVRRIPNGFALTTKTILLIKSLEKKLNLSVGIGSLVMNQNISQRHEIENWAKQNDIPINFQLIGFHQTFVNNLESEKELNYNSDVQHQELKTLLSNYSKPQNLFDVRAYYWQDMYNFYLKGLPRTTPCPFRKDQFVLDSFGDVYYCLSEPKIGNARKEKNVSSIYYDPQNLTNRKRMELTVCRKCNSGCNVSDAVSKDAKHYLWFRLTGQPYYGLKTSLQRLFGQ